ncbi:beta-lactamase/transpeptidase-like protein [Mycena filopes]|nr:beta-lactamase/transpeptidase-like protein [Mycena filopes]
MPPVPFPPPHAAQTEKGSHTQAAETRVLLHRTPWSLVFLTAVISASFALFKLAQKQLSEPSHHLPPVAAPQCHPHLPNLFSRTPIRNDSQEMSTALGAIDALVRSSYSKGGVDGLVVAIVTREGVLYEHALGPLKANETEPDKRGSVDRHSIFRIASGSKLFATLETLILREKGALQWDDPVHKYLPDFSYASGGWSSGSDDEFSSGPITLRQLATHMSGLTREFPRGDMPDWPHSLEGTGAPPTNGRPFPTSDELLAGLKQYPLTVPTYTYPVYSNVGIALLGQVAVAANRAFEQQQRGSGSASKSPTTWPELAQRDIFDPLGLNGSGFVVTPQNQPHVAVASADSYEVDWDFLDAMSCSGGQMSSLADYVKVIQTFLDPRRPGNLLPPPVLREWLRPLHAWEDDTNEVGMLWEIEKIRDSYARPVRIFQKLGSLGASRSFFALHPGASFGIALLMTGSAPPADDLVLSMFRLLQPVLDRGLAEQVAELYAGRWIDASITTRLNANGSASRNDLADSEVVISVAQGSLWISTLRLKGSDVLRLVQNLPQDRNGGAEAEAITMWSTGKLHEFRMVFAVASTSCMRSWATIDDGFARGYPTDLVYFSEEEDARMRMRIPSLDLVLTRV